MADGETLHLTAEEAGERLDAWLARRGGLSRSRASDLITSGRVRVNGSAERKSYRLQAGDEVHVVVPPDPATELLPQDLPFAVVYEDDHLVVVDKPHGLVVHPAPGHPSGTLVNGLLYRYGELSPVGLPLRPGIVHRLDRDTSGLMVVARNEQAHRALSASLQRRQVRRGYLAAVWGRFALDSTTIDRPIGRSPSDRKKMAVVEDGRRAVTHVRHLERWPAADLVAVRLETGRTHQIRVHLADSGHPIVGDPIYGRGWERGMSGASGQWAAQLVRRTGRLFLHSARLAFKHPATDEDMTFTSDLPEELAAAVRWARGPVG